MPMSEYMTSSTALGGPVGASLGAAGGAVVVEGLSGPDPLATWRVSPLGSSRLFLLFLSDIMHAKLVCFSEIGVCGGLQQGKGGLMSAGEYRRRQLAMYRLTTIVVRPTLALPSAALVRVAEPAGIRVPRLTSLRHPLAGFEQTSSSRLGSRRHRHRARRTVT